MHTSSVVYFIVDEGSMLMKIGRTDGDPRTRLRMLQTGNGRKVRMIGSIDGGAKEETILHEAMADRRVQGEWFRVDAEQVEIVRSFCERQEAAVLLAQLEATVAALRK